VRPLRRLLLAGLALFPAVPIAAAETPADVPATSQAAPAATFEASLNRDERALVQRALVWLGLYDGWIDGDFGAGTRAAIGGWQSRADREPTGTLTENETVALLADGLTAEGRLGWTATVDPANGIEIGYPSALMTERSQNESGGNDYVDPIGSGVLSTIRVRDVQQGAIDVFYNLSRRSTDDGRHVTYDFRRGPIFILAGDTASGHFYERFEQRDTEIRGYRLSWAPWENDRYAPIAVAMSNSFYPFGGAPTTPGIYPVIGPLVAAAAARIGEGPAAGAPPTAEASVPAATGGASGEPATPPVKPPDTASGTGFVISREGEILTNAHVIRGCGAIEVGGVGAATVLAVDERRDLALLDTGATFQTTIPIRSGGQLELGEPVTVLGYPYRGIVSTSLTITQGIVSAIVGLDDDPSRFQLTAAVQPGNSGGPVIDEAGRLIGVVAARINDGYIASATGSLPQNVNFGIRVELVDSFLIEHGILVEHSADATPVTAREIAKRIGGLVHPVICQLDETPVASQTPAP
jgi:peptidoglycan hydrolase-like protein with peptidoglycan-binding domain